MICKSCGSQRIRSISAKCDDRCQIYDTHNNIERNDYVPPIQIGGGDYIKFKYCLDCGKIQGKFPEKDLETD